MRIVIARLASAFQFGYVLTFVCVGLAGILLARWELENVFGLDAIGALPQNGATFLSQYRFLKSIEISVGFFALVQRKAILAGKPDAVIFLFVVFAGVVARSAAWISDGAPSTPFTLFLVLEALTFVFVAWNVGARNES